MSTPSAKTNLLAVALGDPAGIGPEVSLKAIAGEWKADAARYLLIGHEPLVRSLNQQLGLGLPVAAAPLKPGATPADSSERLQILDPQSQSLSLPLPKLCAPHSPEAARAAIASLQSGAELCLRGQADALVTAPVNKEAIIRSGATNFTGQTELLSAMAGTNRTAMMLLGSDDRGRWLRVALVTTHLPLSRVAESITRERVELTIELAARSCRELGLPAARVGVCGLNPHAGEGGKIGTEELSIITPAVNEMRNRGLNVTGPLAADTLFYYAFRGDYEAVVAMYHDQGLAPLKMIGFESGVNWTLGLPFIRTSPDHGTAYDIAGQGQANPSSMVSAIRLAKKLAGN